MNYLTFTVSRFVCVSMAKQKFKLDKVSPVSSLPVSSLPVSSFLLHLHSLSLPPLIHVCHCSLCLSFIALLAAPSSSSASVTGVWLSVNTNGE